MKKQLLRCAWLALAVSALLCMSALAAGTASEELGAGFYLGKSEAMTIKPVTEANADITAKTIVTDKGEFSYYQGAVKMEVSCDATAGSQYLVMLVTGSFDKVPGDNNKIIYVDQKAATGSTVTFGVNGKDIDYVYPNLDEVRKDQDQDLTLLITSNDGTAMKKATLYYSDGGDYDVKQYTLGDVDEDGKVDQKDAALILQIDAKLATATPTQLLAADVNSDGSVKPYDAALVLMYDAKLITSWPTPAN